LRELKIIKNDQARAQLQPQLLREVDKDRLIFNVEGHLIERFANG